MTIAEYMALCLSHPEYGYYMNRDPLGVDGDFTTAPEISQMFGEMIGLWLVQIWVDQGRPSPFVLAELGPGRGTLMADILRVSRLVPEFSEAAQVVMMETSPVLRAKQAAHGDVVFVDDVDDLPEGPLFVIANEFFDALPIRQFRRVDSFWQERQVGPELTTVWSRPKTMPDLDQAFPLTADSRIVEINPEAERIAAVLANRITENGAALIIDYGSWDGMGDTLQAVQRHQSVDVFDHNHGTADLTAHVRFMPLASERAHFTTQGAFLHQLGIETRAKTLSATSPEATAAALHRLTDDAEMGSLFKVLALLPETAPRVPGFSDDADNTD